ncbi:MAG: hypothetical protein HPY85_15845 [Anaerolineae bacterium]|nr:hypothetical protein [Anaerolineae bacterium]
MPQTQLPCPQCGRPVVADVTQLFDVGADPGLKNLFLSGQANLAACQNCGYQGPVNLPIVYHDPAKELLLTYFPPELHIPMNQQEQVIGPLIRKVVDNLPPEKRKGYLFKPQTMLTFQRMLEVVLEADGITPEMMKRQQERLQLLQRLIPMDESSRKHVVAQDAALIDEEFFQMINSVLQITASQGDQNGAKMLAELQQFLFANTEKGKELKAQVDEAQAAIKSLQEASRGGGLTQEKLLDLVVAAPTQVRLMTLVNYAFQGLDYTFFALLKQRIEAASGEEKQRLTGLRDRLLEMRQQIEKEVAEQTQAMRDIINEIIESDPMEEAVGKYAQAINQTFVDVLQDEIERAHQAINLDRSEKLQHLMDIITEATQAPPEIQLAQELLSADSDEELEAMLADHDDQVNSELAQALGMLVQQVGERDDIDQDTKDRLQNVYNKVLRISMKKNLSKN